ncbi:MAG: DUF2029 domain-containing protein [Solobacterium sp.]|nr:DUF2029 domain-containing protein [Solobacterium sp.]
MTHISHKPKKLKHIKLIDVFIILLFLNTFLFLLYACRTGVNAQKWLAMWNFDDNSFDFKIHVVYAADPENLYYNATGIMGCFPPFAYLFYRFIYNLVRIPGVTLDTLAQLNTYEFINIIVSYYNIFVCLLFLYAVNLFAEIEKQKRCLLFIGLLFTVPLYECILIGNSVFPVLSFILIALKYRKSESPVKREIALLLIAVSAGFKMYPAIFGFLYIFEKRYAEGFRLLLYGLLIFFVPFAFFGGMNGFAGWLNNANESMSLLIFGRIQSIRSIIYTFLKLAFDLEFGTAFYSIIAYVFLVIMLILSWLSKTEYYRLLFLSSAMIFFPTYQHRYTLIYFIIPLMFYFDQEKKSESDAADYLFVLLQAGVFTIPMIYGYFTKFYMTFSYDMLTFVELRIFIFAYLLLVYAVGHELFAIIRR